MNNTEDVTLQRWEKEQPEKGKEDPPTQQRLHLPIPPSQLSRLSPSNPKFKSTQTRLILKSQIAHYAARKIYPETWIIFRIVHLSFLKYFSPPIQLEDPNSPGTSASSEYGNCIHQLFSKNWILLQSSMT